MTERDEEPRSLARRGITALTWRSLAVLIAGDDVARFPNPLPKASGSGNLSTSGHPDPGRNAAHYRVSTNLCQQSHTKLMPSGHSFHNFKYPFFLTTVWIKIIVLSRSILITIQFFPNSAKDLEVRLNFEQATYCLRDWGASPYMTNNLL